ncbi:MAG: ScpA family protein [Candidatus Woesearchaeota archaeon]
MQEKLYQIIVESDDISWKSILLDLVNSEQMNPWDIDIGVLTQRYIERIKQLKETNLKVSGKVLLAAAILLKIKSKRLVGEDMDEFDRLLAASDISEEQFYDELEQALAKGEVAGMQDQTLELIPRLPQPRKRKVSVYDLVRALEKALEVKKRRLFNSLHEVNVVVPEKKLDITAAMRSLYAKLLSIFAGGKRKLTFSSLVPTNKKEDKVYTFIPLLHLANESKVELGQKEHFGEIEISQPEEGK